MGFEMELLLVFTVYPKSLVLKGKRWSGEWGDNKEYITIDLVVGVVCKQRLDLGLMFTCGDLSRYDRRKLVMIVLGRVNLLYMVNMNCLFGSHYKTNILELLNFYL